MTAPRLVDTIENGKPFAGFRRAHARGVCVAGPCAGASLKPWPIHIERGEVFTA